MSNAIETRRYVGKDGKTYQVEVFYDEGTNNPRDEYDCYQTVIATRRDRDYVQPEQDLDYYIPRELIEDDGKIDSNKIKKWIALSTITGNHTPGGKPLLKHSRALDGTALIRYAFLDRASSGTIYRTYPEDAHDHEMFDGIIVCTIGTAGDKSITDPAYYTEQRIDGKPVPDLWIEGELDEYNNWSEGNVFGYVCSEQATCDHGDEHYDEVDSCWGFIAGDIEYLFNEAVSVNGLVKEMP